MLLLYMKFYNSVRIVIFGPKVLHVRVCHSLTSSLTNVFFCFRISYIIKAIDLILCNKKYSKYNQFDVFSVFNSISQSVRYISIII